MKSNLIIFCLLISTILQAQSAYIQVVGEPNLSVFLNNSFKAKTTSDLGGCIIENVTPGKNLIKIVKDGYTPFEETITVKSGEVLEYKVKSFTKHKVYVSEEGNTNETDKKAIVKTGKLIIQSVPIEIKITITDIDGINNSAKTKDKWQADEIPEGEYKIAFIYNKKIITKTVEIIGNETTSLFVNMLNGDFKSNNTVEDEIKKIKEGEVRFMNYIHSNYKIGLTVEETKKAYPELSLKIIKHKNQTGELEELVSSKKNIKFYVKNNVVIGYQGEVDSDKERTSFSLGTEYDSADKKVNGIKDELTENFNFLPITEKTGDSYFKKGKTTSYSWKKNNKKVILKIHYLKKEKMFDAVYLYTIDLTIIDEK
tara:strand:- start:58 stop:1164 length:1107 start_codon:yes stop_codon:yes gene_type:complete